jgi:hypothetical protein
MPFHCSHNGTRSEILAPHGDGVNTPWRLIGAKLISSQMSLVYDVHKPTSNSQL